MRTWEQLIVEANATGTYGSYAGDGASVPWQTCGFAVPPLGLSMALYKVWLDSHYPAAFKLHDWCYTLYGSLIGVTQLEADEALRTQILAIGGIASPLDAALVYAAVRLGGAYYFGTSLTGFDQAVYDEALMRRAPWVGGSNMGLAPRMEKSKMAIKVVIVFQQSTLGGYSVPSLGLAGRTHIGGWTEHLWYPTDDIGKLWTALTVTNDPLINWGLLQLRADMLTENASIVGVRLYEGGSGKGIFRAFSVPGRYSAANSDIPSLALLAYVGLATTVKAKRLTLRGMPDHQAKGGEFTPDQSMQDSLRYYGLALGAFGAVTKNDNAGLPIINVTDVGVVQLNGIAPTFGIGVQVQFRQMVNQYGQRVGGKFATTAINSPSNQFTVAGWNLGPCTGGNVLVQTSSLKTIIPGSLVASRLVTRQVGRPFEQYRGRSSKRRR